MQRWVTEEYFKLEAARKPLECIQHPGQVMYIPEGWHHAHMNVGEAVAVVHRSKIAQKQEIQFRSFARERRAAGHLDEAIDIAEMMVKQFPGYPDGFVLLASMLLERLSSDAAKSTLTDVETVYTEIERHLAVAIRLDPGSWDAHFTMCDVMLRNNKTTTAAKACLSAIELNPENAQIHFLRGTALRALNLYGQAADAFEVAATLSPSDADAHFFHAECAQMAGGNLHTVVDAFNKSLSIQDDNAEAHANMGLALAELDLNREAVNHLQKAIDLDPEAYKTKYAGVVKEMALIADTEDELGGGTVAKGEL